MFPDLYTWEFRVNRNRTGYGPSLEGSPPPRSHLGIYLLLFHIMSTFAPIKTCVLGVGLAGLTFHIPFILALPEYFTLVSVLERNPQSEGGKLRERFGVSAKIHNNLDQVLADPEIELVIIGAFNKMRWFRLIRNMYRDTKPDALFLCKGCVRGWKAWYV
jgi:hypothetical protein